MIVINKLIIINDLYGCGRFFYWIRAGGHILNKKTMSAYTRYNTMHGYYLTRHFRQKARAPDDADRCDHIVMVFHFCEPS